MDFRIVNITFAINNFAAFVYIYTLTMTVWKNCFLILLFSSVVTISKFMKSNFIFVNFTFNTLHACKCEMCLLIGLIMQSRMPKKKKINTPPPPEFSNDVNMSETCINYSQLKKILPEKH